MAIRDVPFGLLPSQCSFSQLEDVDLSPKLGSTSERFSAAESSDDGDIYLRWTDV